MHITLVNPFDHTHVRKLLGLAAPPLNLMYLASSLRRDGFSVRIIDDNLEGLGPKEISEIVRSERPGIVGFTSATSTLNSAFSYIEAIKRVSPETVTVLGGPHVSFLPTETLSQCRDLDVAVVGEGEETINELAQKIESSGNLSDIKGIAYRAGDSIRINPKRELIRNLDDLPLPARDLIDYGRYKDPITRMPLGNMITSRGCVFGCLYCASSRMMGSKFRYRNPDAIIEEMSELVDKYHAHDIEFIDDNFMLNRKRAMAIAAEIKKNGIETDFAASSRVDSIDSSVIRSLRQSGLSTLYLGLESGSQRVLDLMNKGIVLKQGIDSVKMAKENSIRVFGSFMYGYPGETLEEMNRTTDYAIKLDLDFAQFSILTPYPGTPIYEDLLENDLLAVKDYDRFTAVDPIVAYERLGLSSGSVVMKLNMAYLRFYCRPRYLLKHPYMIKIIPKALIGSLFRNERREEGRGWARPSSL